MFPIFQLKKCTSIPSINIYVNTRTIGSGLMVFHRLLHSMDAPSSDCAALYGRSLTWLLHSMDAPSPDCAALYGRPLTWLCCTVWTAPHLTVLHCMDGPHLTAALYGRPLTWLCCTVWDGPSPGCGALYGRPPTWLCCAVWTALTWLLHCMDTPSPNWCTVWMAPHLTVVHSLDAPSPACAALYGRPLTWLCCTFWTPPSPDCAALYGRSLTWLAALYGRPLT